MTANSRVAPNACSSSKTVNCRHCQPDIMNDNPAQKLAVQVNYADVAAAAERLRGVGHRTPVASSRQADELAGARVFFKCENLQRIGAFKFRGAYNAVSLIPAADRGRGVVTHSSGNHAQAIALASKLAG